MRVKSKNLMSDCDLAFWRAYFEILNERVQMVDKWRDGSVTWHPRVAEKLLWYSEMPNTARNRRLAHDWLMQNCTEPVKERTVGDSLETGL
jgi:hypothetical protein